MAEASIALEIAINKLVTFTREQIGLIASASDDVREIQSKSHSIKAVLMDAERKQITNENVREWLLKLKGIALDMEDVVDEWQISSNFVKSYKVGVQLKEIRKRLDAILGDRLMYTFSSSTSVGGGSETIGVSSHWRQTSSLVEVSHIIGRDKDKETVISWLVNDALDGQQQQPQEVHVTAIVGVGGLGKTTLAQQIFNDPKVKDHFNDFRYWVCVSDVFDVIELTKDILKAIGTAFSSRSFNYLQRELLESLKGKRFLLVLDDVWNEYDEKWEILRLSLKSGAQGSRILVTTRSIKVAEIMNASSRIHELKGLSDDLSWKLFCGRAFPEKKPEEFLEFESIGRKIVKKCRGVPLSIKVMGSLMNEKTMADWENILNSEMWSLPEVKDRILSVLLKSYYNLPHSLKQCFSFCSICKKDTVMKKNELVHLWVAQGFIRPQGNKVPEDIGEDYFNDLEARSMFQEVDENEIGETVCKLHGLLHDLATFITEDESYIFTESKNSNPPRSSIGGVRHASLILDGDNARISLASCPRKKLRTLVVNDLDETRGVADKLFGEARFLRALVFRDCRGMKVLPVAIGKLKHLRYLDLSGSSIADLPEKAIKELNLLRYLDLSGTGIKKLPDTLGKMEQLRYLDLSHTRIEELPETVGHLVNLHTLNLSWCRSLKTCGGICDIIGLRHLYFEGTAGLKFLPKGIGKLTSLQSLRKFRVGGDKGEYCGFRVGGDKGEYCGIDELQELNSIQGRLEIEGLDQVSDAEQASRAQLCTKHGVRDLVLDISSRGGRGVEDDKDEERIKVLECLRPHPNLQKLKLNANCISKLRLPSWLEDPSFANLSRLEIFGFEKWKPNNSMPGLGKLPGLKCLTISKSGVKKLGDEFYYGNGIGTTSAGRGVAFPKLESLTLEYMKELEEWELTGEADASKVMPCLRELTVSNFPSLQLLPSHLATSATPPTSSTSEVPEASKSYCDNELKPLPPASEHVSKPLEHLDIFGCEKLQSLPQSLGQLKKLKSLSIWYAIELTRLPDSLGQLESLENLEIRGCYELEPLPDSLGGLKKLKSFYIRQAEKLESLPDSLGQLTSLESLGIHDCDKLKSLPHSLGRLQKLQELRIHNCPQLPYNSNGRREEWPEISHIPTIIIDGKRF